ncbi:hypothetical protein DW757_12715 [Clostridium sp. AM29-11AC]|nr:hypothetical protein DW757_12715 [Clostridium sp. AM29-11AC]
MDRGIRPAGHALPCRAASCRKLSAQHLAQPGLRRIRLGQDVVLRRDKNPLSPKGCFTFSEKAGFLCGSRRGGEMARAVRWCRKRGGADGGMVRVVCWHGGRKGRN